MSHFEYDPNISGHDVESNELQRRLQLAGDADQAAVALARQRENEARARSIFEEVISPNIQLDQSSTLRLSMGMGHVRSFSWNGDDHVYYDPEIFKEAHNEQYITESVAVATLIQSLLLQSLGADSTQYYVSSSQDGFRNKTERLVFQSGKTYFVRKRE